MDWQQIVSLTVVAAAFAFIVRRELRKHRRRKAVPCAGDCSCPAVEMIVAKQRQSAREHDRVEGGPGAGGSWQELT